MSSRSTSISRIKASAAWQRRLVPAAP